MNSPPLRVFHLGKYYPPYKGGIETVVSTLCRGLGEKGIRCIVAATDPRKSGMGRDGRGVVVRRLRAPYSIKSQPLCPQMLWALKSARADVIHIHHPNPAADVALFISNCRQPVVVSYHSDVVNQQLLRRLCEPLLNMTLKRAAVVVVSSQEYADSSPILKNFRHKVRVIPYGLHPPKMNGMLPPFSSPRKTPDYLFIGRLVPYKGIEVLIHAISLVRGNLRIVGTGPCEGRLKQMVCEKGLTERVTFLGSINDDEKFLRLSKCDAFVLPSLTRAEAFGVVLLEAMWMRRPIVVSDLPTGVRMLVRHGQNGLRFPPGDSAALASCLQSLDSDPAEARRMGERGRELVECQWTAARMIDGYARIYTELCSNRERASK